MRERESCEQSKNNQYNTTLLARGLIIRYIITMSTQYAHKLQDWLSLWPLSPKLRCVMAWMVHNADDDRHLVDCVAWLDGLDEEVDYLIQAH